MRRPGISVEEFDRLFRRRVEDRLINVLANSNCAHRHAAIGDGLGHRNDVGSYMEGLCGEILPGAAEAADYLVEDQQNSMPRAYFPQPLKIAHRRHVDTGGSGDRLHDTRRDVFRSVEVDHALQVLCKLDALSRLPDRKTVLFEQRMSKV